MAVLGSSKLVSRWIVATVAASLIAVIAGGLAGWLALAPSRIWRGELWRLVTWVLVVPGPLCLVTTCASLYRFGGDLAHRWGDRRLLRFLLEVLTSAAAATALLGLLSSQVWFSYHVGGWAVCDALVIAWARQYPERVVAISGLVQLSGRQLIAATIAITSIYAVFRGPLAALPELFTCAVAYYYPRARLVR